MDERYRMYEELKRRIEEKTGIKVLKRKPIDPNYMVIGELRSPYGERYFLVADLSEEYKREISKKDCNPKITYGYWR